MARRCRVSLPPHPARPQSRPVNGPTRCMRRPRAWTFMKMRFPGHRSAALRMRTRQARRWRVCIVRRRGLPRRAANRARHAIPPSACASSPKQLQCQLIPLRTLLRSRPWQPRRTKPWRGMSSPSSPLIRQPPALWWRKMNRPSTNPRILFSRRTSPSLPLHPHRRSRPPRSSNSPAPGRPRRLRSMN